MILSVIVGRPADGRPVDVDDGDGMCAEDAHAADPGGVVRGVEHAVAQGGERYASTDVDGYVAPLCCRCTCVSAALSSGDDRGLESGYADSGLDG